MQKHAAPTFRAKPHISTDLFPPKC